MDKTRGHETTGWGWGTSRQLFVCRLSHAFGLVVVLGALWALGWTPIGDSAQRTAPAVAVVETRSATWLPALEHWREAPGMLWNGIQSAAHTLVRRDDADDPENLAHN